MRAMAHPVRLALIEAVTLRGPLTATEAGEIIGETATTCSFHLRQLAKYGFVEEAGGGVGRARPWRAVQIGFHIDPDPDDAAGKVAASTLAEVALARQIARHREARQRESTADEWREVVSHNETVWWVTPDELAALYDEIRSLVSRYVTRLADPSTRPEGAVPVEFVSLIHPFDSLDQES
jgi:predicted ArsR family transcriptional regulator